MRLLLLSQGLGALEDFVPARANIAFIPTAGEIYDDPYFVRNDREQLVKRGYQIHDVDISRSSKNDVLANLNDADAIFVAGGNTFYLLQQLREKDVDQDLCSLVRAGKPYIGSSAGAVVVGPHLDPIEALDDPDAAPRIETRRALGLTDFVVLPHYGRPTYMTLYRDIIARHGANWPLVPLADDEALLVTASGQYKKIPSSQLADSP